MGDQYYNDVRQYLLGNSEDRCHTYIMSITVSGGKVLVVDMNNYIVSG